METRMDAQNKTDQTRLYELCMYVCTCMYMCSQVLTHPYMTLNSMTTNRYGKLWNEQINRDKRAGERLYNTWRGRCGVKQTNSIYKQIYQCHRFFYYYSTLILFLWTYERLFSCLLSFVSFVCLCHSYWVSTPETKTVTHSCEQSERERDRESLRWN